MSDYTFDVHVNRGLMAFQLACNTEQFVFSVTNAIDEVDFDYALELGCLGDEVTKKEKVVDRLRRLADAIEAGEIS